MVLLRFVSRRLTGRASRRDPQAIESQQSGERRESVIRVVLERQCYSREGSRGQGFDWLEVAMLGFEALAEPGLAAG